MLSPLKRILMPALSRLPLGLQSLLRRFHYARKLRRARLSDEPDLALIGLLTKPGDVVLDIGANFGLFTRFLSESVGDRGRVYAFEPTEDMYVVLAHNCTSLGLKNVRSFRTALSDRCGSSHMHIPQREDGSLNHYEASLAAEGGSGRTVVVETCTLDDFCRQQELERIDFIKCDVEGHELEVLAGARRTLRQHRPTLLIEVNEPLDGGGHGSRVLERIRDLDYEVHHLCEGGLRPWKPGETNVNYVLKPRLRADLNAPALTTPAGAC